MAVSLPVGFRSRASWTQPNILARNRAQRLVAKEDKKQQARRHRRHMETLNDVSCLFYSRNSRSKTPTITISALTTSRPIAIVTTVLELLRIKPILKHHPDRFGPFKVYGNLKDKGTLNSPAFKPNQRVDSEGRRPGLPPQGNHNWDKPGFGFATMRQLGQLRVYNSGLRGPFWALEGFYKDVGRFAKILWPGISKGAQDLRIYG